MSCHAFVPLCLIGLKLLGILAFVGDRPNYWERFGLVVFLREWFSP
jgi:hypothetical protein